MVDSQYTGETGHWSRHKAPAIAFLRTAGFGRLTSMKSISFLLLSSGQAGPEDSRRCPFTTMLNERYSGVTGVESGFHDDAIAA